MISLVSLLVALVLGVAACIRHWPGARKALTAVVRSLGVGAAGGAAFLVPFLGAFQARHVPTWHGPFGWYVAAGSACLLVVAAPFARYASGRAPALVGALALVLVSGLLGGLGVIELALLPAVGAAALSALAWLRSPRARALAALLAAPGVVLLPRPALYRDGVLTGTLPELSADWVVASIALGALLLPAGAAILRALLEAVAAKSLPRARRPAIVLALLLAVGLVPMALTRAPYDEGAPETARFVHRMRRRGPDEVFIEGAIDHVETTLGGKPVPLVFDGRFASTSLAPTPPLATIRTDLLPGGRVRITVEPTRGAPPIDRVTIRYEGGRADYDVQIFGAGKGSAVDERAIPPGAISAEVEVHFTSDPSGLDVRARGPVALHRQTILVAVSELRSEIR